MPIVNEKDEQNPNNSRTIDTETGVYLRYTGGRPNEGLVFFEVTDGDFKFRLETEKKVSDTKVLHQVYAIHPVINPKYKGQISLLLQEHKSHYGPIGKINRDYFVDFSRVEHLFFEEGDEA